MRKTENESKARQHTRFSGNDSRNVISEPHLDGEHLEQVIHSHHVGAVHGVRRHSRVGRAHPRAAALNAPQYLDSLGRGQVAPVLIEVNVVELKRAPHAAVDVAVHETGVEAGERMEGVGKKSARESGTHTGRQREE